MTGAWIAGAAMTQFGRTGGGLRALTEQAAAGALDDAGIEPAEVQQVFFANGAAGLLQGQEMIRGQVLLRNTGLLGRPIINVENACASSSTAFYLATTAVATGAVDVALALGVEELVVPVKTRSFAAFASATDLEQRDDMRRIVRHYALGDETDGPAPDLSASPFMAHYAAKGRAYMSRTGATEADLARVTVKSRGWGSLNPRAQFRQETTVEEVLAARMVCAPLRVPMCAPVGNGAAAVVVVSERAADRLAAQLRVRATALVSHDPAGGLRPTVQAAHLAYTQAGVGPRDIDIVELHDAAASAELILMEELGLCGPGEAFGAVRDGRTGLGGDLPVNTGGGLLSRGHPVGATGCAQLVELADQLLGRAGPRQVPNARLGLAQNGGGVIEDDEATVCVSILERAR